MEVPQVDQPIPSTSSTMSQNTKTDSLSIKSLSSEVANLTRETKNFNLHVKVLKRLLNLKDRKSGYEMFMLPKNNEDEEDEGETEADHGVILSDSLHELADAISELKAEIQNAHLLGFCLAYNVQHLRKRLTGVPVDIHSSAEFVNSLQKKYDISKTREAILKYEFQEKRKLLRKLRSQLEETREEWRNIRITKPEKESEEAKLMWSQLMRKNFRQKDNEDSADSGFTDGATGSGFDSGDSAVQSESDNDNCDAIAEALIKRKNKLDNLEEECYNLLTHLANKHKAPTDYEDGKRYTPTYTTHPPLLYEINSDDTDDDYFDEEADETALSGSEENDVEAPLELLSIDADTSTETISETVILDSDEISESQTNIDEQQSSTGDLHTNAGSSAENREAESNDDEDEESSNKAEEEMIAETGEPIVLCRLRRKAVEVLISRLRDEKVLHESRESELKAQLTKMSNRNRQLETQIEVLKRKSGPAYLAVAGLIGSFLGFLLVLRQYL